MKVSEILTEDFITDEEEMLRWVRESCTNEARDIYKNHLSINNGFVDSDREIIVRENVKRLRVKFGKVRQHFSARGGLTSMMGLPQEIVPTENDNETWISFAGCRFNKIDHKLPFVFEAEFSGCTNLTDLTGIEKYVSCEQIFLPITIKKGMLSLMKIPQLKAVHVTTSEDPKQNADVSKATNIITMYLGKGRAGMIDAQEKLSDADLEDLI